jgi:hypothetical protein
MSNDPNRNSTAAQTEPAQHHSTFAEGECGPEAYPEEEHIGAFAEVQETRPAAS